MDLENIIQFSFKIVAIFSILKIDVDLGGINGIYLHQLTLIVPAKNFQASVKCRKAQKCLYLTLSIQCHMQLKLLMSLTAV